MTDENAAKITLTLVGVGGTLLGTAFGGFITWLITRTTQALQKQLARDTLKAQERAAIDTLLVKLLDFLMAYPHLEKDDFCQKYPAVPGHENGKERYEVYCIFVFNFLMRAFKHFDCDAKLLGDYIGLEEIVGCHHKWWFHDDKNLEYDEPFQQCIQAVFNKMRKDGKIK